MVENRINSSNCLVLSHVRQPYYDFHLHSFGDYFSNISNLYYTEYFSKFGLLALESEIRNIINERKIDVVILWQWPNFYGLRVEFLAEIRKKTFIILWLFDDELFFHSFSKYYAQASDVVVTTDYYGKIAYEQLGIESIFYLSSYDKTTYYPMKVKKDIDVSFVGAISKNDRKVYIDFLVLNDIRVKIYGSDTVFVSNEEMVRIFSRSKICLNFTKMAFDDEAYMDNPFIDRIRQNKGRPVEIGLTRSFCLSEDAPSLKKLFRVGEELDVFSTKEELLEKINYYLHHNNERESMARSLYKKCTSEYEKSKYFPWIFKQLFESKRKKHIAEYRIEKSANFAKREASFFTKKVWKFLFQQKSIVKALECHKEAVNNGWIFFIRFSIYFLTRLVFHKSLKIIK